MIIRINRHEGIVYMRIVRAFLVLVTVLILAACQSEDTINFSDDHLADGIRAELDIEADVISEADLENVRRLNLDNYEIESLEGIEQLESLRNLSLRNNEITDLSPLLELEDLRRLNVIGNPAVDVDEQLALIDDLIEQGINVEFEQVIGRSDGPGGFLWKVENNGTTVYLQGTIHVGTQDFYPLHEKIELAYHEADVIVPEIDMNNIDLMEVQRIYAELGEYNDGTTIRDHLDDETYEELANMFLEFGMPIELFEQYKPWFLSSLIQSLMVEQLGYLYGVDDYFLQKAQIDGKEVIPLETPEFQFNVLADVSDAYQIEMLKDSIVDIEDYDEELQEMFALYKAGDVDELLDYLFVETDEDYEFAEEAQQYMEALNDDRNYGMADKIAEFLENDEEKTYFVIVGTLHLILEPHVGSILEEMGYNVERVH